MACLGRADVDRIVASGLPAVDGAAAHLASCDACAAIVAAAVRANRRGDRPAEQLGRYELLKERGRGAFGTVFEAYDPALERRVAIKRIAFTSRWSPSAVAELLREAKAMAQIQHPNVVPIFDAGRADDGVFLTMPIVDGETLDAWAARERANGTLDADRVIAQFANKLGAGLAAVHAAGFVHRDIKPSNLLVAGTGAWVADLGLARRVAPPVTRTGTRFDGELTASTLTESFAGTPAYLAPECLVGGTASPASDQYALAVTLVEVITGNRPFAGNTYLELLAAACEKPPRLDGVPRRYHAALIRALSPDPAQRFESIAAFARSLAAAVPRRGRDRIAMVALAVIAVAAIVVAARSRRTDAVAVAPAPPRALAPDAGSTAPSIDAAVVTPAAPSIDAAVVTPVAPSCVDGCASAHRRAVAACAQDEAACRATSSAAFEGCTETLDAKRCAGLEAAFVRACTGHEVALDGACAERARRCEATCETTRCTARSADDCRAAWMTCRANVDADRERAKQTRRRGWDDCAQANTACRDPDCAAQLQRCNGAVAAAFERADTAATAADDRCRITQQECVTNPTPTCEPTCRASCASASYECMATPRATHACTSAADAALARCRQACR